MIDEDFDWRAEPIFAPHLEAIATERARHEQLGWTAKHDEGHQYELRAAAFCYLQHARVELGLTDVSAAHRAIAAWPWGDHLWKPSTPERMLVKAGALYEAADDVDRRMLAIPTRRQHRVGTVQINILPTVTAFNTAMDLAAERAAAFAAALDAFAAAAWPDISRAARRRVTKKFALVKHRARVTARLEQSYRHRTGSTL